MPKKLTYFDVNGLAESIRYMLFYTGEEFEDVRQEVKSWPVKEIKDKLPFGQLPLLEEDGRTLHQSLAIARYVAAGSELLPADPWEQAQLDSAVLTLYDLLKHFVAWAWSRNPVEKVEMKKKLYEEHFDFYFSRFDKQIEESGGHFGKKLSWADFVFVGLLECFNLYLKDDVVKNYPNIIELMKEVQSLPGVKDYIRERKPYDVSFLDE